MMTRRTTLALLATAGLTLLGACSGGRVPLPGLLTPLPSESQRPVDLASLPSLRLVGWTVEVPQTLTVSEANGIKPRADIVWREDPLGDRHPQVKAIIEEALRQAAPEIRGELPVNVQLTVTRFHALTERTRYSIGGLHEIRFDMQVVDARTGEVIIPTYPVDATFEGYGGELALAAERISLTQKKRIIDHLRRTFISELTGRIVPSDLPEPTETRGPDGKVTYSFGPQDPGAQ